jgi:hypothetical protein
MLTMIYSPVRLRRYSLCHTGTLLATALGGCASRQAGSFSAGRPLFEPGVYFNGPTHSWGIIESRGGEPDQVLTTQTQGHWEGDTFHFEQDLLFEKEKGSTDRGSSVGWTPITIRLRVRASWAKLGEKLTEKFFTWSSPSISLPAILWPMSTCRSGFIFSRMGAR